MDASRDAHRPGGSAGGGDASDVDHTAGGGADHNAAGGAGEAAAQAPSAERPVRARPLLLIWRTLVRAWDDGIFGMSAQAAFWMTLSLPPLLLGLLGSLGFVGRWFGPDTINVVQGEILRLATTVFNPAVVDQIIRPTVTDILTQGRSSIVSVGFVLSLWAGSSALASLVDSTTAAYRQHTVRNPVWQRTFALLLYVILLFGSVFVLPLVALGPGLIPGLFPVSVRSTVADLVAIFYYPVLGVLLVLGLATLYKIVLPNKHPWHRGLPGALLAMVVFLVSSTCLRLYIAWVTSTGYTYGALATPIAFLLFSFFIAMAIVLGAEFNYTIEELWPSHSTRRERRRWRRLEMERRSARDRAEHDQGQSRAEHDQGQRRAEHDGSATTTSRNGSNATADGTSPGAPSPADTNRTVDLPRNGSPSTAENPSAAENPRAAENPDQAASEPPASAPGM
jgi:membrane protein